MQIRAEDFRDNWPDALTASFEVAGEAAKQVESAAKEAAKAKEEIAAARRDLRAAKNDLTNALANAVSAAEKAAGGSSNIKSFSAFAILFMFIGGVVGVIIGQAIAR